MTLLIADDELLIRQGLQSLDWASLGINEVYTVRNGLEARDLLLSVSIDLLITDIKMPGMTGLELAAMIQEKSLDTAVVLLTGFSEFEYARTAMRSGVYEYLLKPLRPKEILQTMSQVIRTLEQKRYQDRIIRHQQEQPGAEGYDLLNQVKKRFPQVSPVMGEMLQEMVRNYHHTLSIGEIADQFHFSRNYLSKLFRKETGCSYTDLLTAIRLTQAARQLLEGKRVSTVSEQTGFHDQRYFSQVFKKVFNCMPKEFAKQAPAPADLHFAALLDRISGQEEEET